MLGAEQVAAAIGDQEAMAIPVVAVSGILGPSHMFWVRRLSHQRYAPPV